MNIILAPHVDDEVIGCYQLLKEGSVDKVVYFFELDDARKKEAQKMAEHFKVDVSFEGFEFAPDYEDTIYIPSKHDAHVHHQQVNKFYRGHSNVFFYSGDKNFKQAVLPEEDYLDKKTILDTLYPSQKKLWENDAKYYLFETILPSDEETYIYCSHQFEGIHQWKDADNYLQHPHRHMFHVKLYLEVFHDDRDIEFIKIKNELAEFCVQYYSGRTFTKSCEMIGAEIKKFFEKKYKRNTRISVSEDGENGAIIF